MPEDRLKADLHIHTSFSDGVFHPEKLLRIADHKKLDVIAFADHDTIDGYLCGRKILQDAGSDFRVKLIPGIEISCFYKGCDVHILAYHFDANHKALLDVLDFNLQERESRMQRFIDKFAEYDVFLTPEDIKSDKIHTLGRPHIANALVKNGYASSYAEAFSKFLVEESPTFVAKKALSPEKVIAAIKAAGGYSVLAHPFRLDDEQMVHDIVDMGVQGLEAHYISHNDEMVSKYLQIAREKDLLVTGGSDFHWPTKNKKLGDFYCKEVSTTILAHSELE